MTIRLLEGATGGGEVRRAAVISELLAFADRWLDDSERPAAQDRILAAVADDDEAAYEAAVLDGADDALFSAPNDEATRALSLLRELRPEPSEAGFRATPELLEAVARVRRDREAGRTRPMDDLF